MSAGGGDLRYGPDISFEAASRDVIDYSHKTTVSLKNSSTRCNIIQKLKPLSKNRPYFTVKILKLGDTGIVSVGLADDRLTTDVHPGHWAGSVAYFTNGRTVSSRLPDPPHKDITSKTARQGDVIGVGVIHFGSNTSVVMFFLNGLPVCTRYLYEMDHSTFLPTVGLENSPVMVEVQWQEAFSSCPSLHLNNVVQWMCPKEVEVNPHRLSFTLQSGGENDRCILQAPTPLMKDEVYVEMESCSCNGPGYGPVIGVMGCDAHFPTPTHSYYKPFIVYDTGQQEHLRVMEGTRIGIGILSVKDKEKYYIDKDSEDEADIVIVYFTLNGDIISTTVTLQPEGGWYPFILLRPTAPELKLIRRANTPPRVWSLLEQFVIREELLTSIQTTQQETRDRVEGRNNVMASDAVQVLQNGGHYTRLRVTPEVTSLQHVFYNETMSSQLNTFIVRIRKLGDSSRVYIGVSPSSSPPWFLPGMTGGSTGYCSSSGIIYNNSSSDSHSHGHRYGQGDEITVFCQFISQSVSVFCFLKNNKPVGTCFCDRTNGSPLLPVVALSANGGEVLLEVVWQSDLDPRDSPNLNPTNLEQWCMTGGIEVDPVEGMAYISPSCYRNAQQTPVSMMQCPVSLTRDFNHFEIELLDDIGEGNPPPAICLCNASPSREPPRSAYHKDFLRFWAISEGCNLKRGDLVGFGVFHPDPNTPKKIVEDPNTTDRQEQLVLIYLTINRQVALVRVLMQPPGGFYPVVLVPPNVEMVKFNFDAMCLRLEDLPLTDQQIKYLLERTQEDMMTQLNSHQGSKVKELEETNYTLEEIDRAMLTTNHSNTPEETIRQVQKTVKSSACDIL